MRVQGVVMREREREREFIREGNRLRERRTSMLQKETEHLFRGNPGGRRTSAWTWSRRLQRFESDEPIAKKQVVWVY